MKVVAFNTEIFEMLMKCGFRYCYSRTAADEQSGNISILLTPTESKPNVRDLPLHFDTFYSINREPRQMANGIDGETSVFVNLNHTLIRECYEQEDINY